MMNNEAQDIANLSYMISAGFPQCNIKLKLTYLCICILLQPVHRFKKRFLEEEEDDDDDISQRWRKVAKRESKSNALQSSSKIIEYEPVVNSVRH